MIRKLAYLIIFFFSIGLCSAQALEREIAILDLTSRNNESNDAQLFSVEHMLKVAGIPYIITTDPDEAMQYAMLICSASVDANVFSASDITNISDYVYKGGVFMVARLTDEALFPLFGITSASSSNTNYLLHWNSNLSSSNIFKWINEPEEWTISLGKESLGSIFKTYSYELSSAIEIAHYDNNLIAVSQNKYGNGYAYNLGFNWKDVIMRGLINRDYEAQRISSNGFEPSMDMMMLLARGIYAEHIPFSTWKHSSPNNSTSSLIITHDIDSSTALDTMFMFSESEKNLGITANYNITVRYLGDNLMTDFYTGRQDKIFKVINNGGVIGSHSVGHFPDFGDDAVFPIGSLGNDTTNYRPYNNGEFTIGGTVYGECEVSKNLLEADLDVSIQTFRTGHLVYNKYLVDVLDDLGYKYNSSYAANEVLTNFPFQNKKGRSFSGDISSVYEFPVSVSDVFHADPISEENYLEKADLWLDVVSKIDANNAVSVLLIHPNRTYKLLCQEYFLSKLPGTINIEEMGAFGAYWKQREKIDFKTELSDNKLTISLLDEDLMVGSGQSIVIQNGQALDGISATGLKGSTLDFTSENWADNDLILFDFQLGVGLDDLESVINDNIKIYPNPVSENIFIELKLNKSSTVSIELYNVFGKSIKKEFFSFNSIGLNTLIFSISEFNLNSGIYFCQLKVGEKSFAVRKVIVN